MPYKTIKELPPDVQSVLERSGQELWMKTFNDAWHGDDAAAAKIAWKKFATQATKICRGGHLGAGWHRIKSGAFWISQSFLHSSG